MRPFRPRPLIALSVLVVALTMIALGLGVCAARDHVDGLDDDRTSWTASFTPGAARLIRHMRTGEIRREGSGAELFDVEVFAAVTSLHLGTGLPPARLIDDLKLSLWLQSNQDGAALAVRVVFPNQIDPATRKPLTVLLDGDPYTKVGQWQQLECTELPAKLKRVLPQLRKKLQTTAGQKNDLDLRELHVDAAVIKVNTSRGTSRFVIDELRLEGIADAPAESQFKNAEHATRREEPDAILELSLLKVRGQPFFPRPIPYRGEQPLDLARIRLNLVWVPDYRDVRLLEDLEKVGLRAMAYPPRAGAEEGGSAGSTSAHLASFGTDTSRILLWYLGTRIIPENKKELAAWQEQILNADRVFHQPRPLMGDVAGLEKTYSKQLSMLGVSRAPVHSSFGFKPYRDWLIERRNLARPGSFMWTWIQTEPTPAGEAIRQSAGWSAQVFEPEQLRCETYAALAAGCRGIGFWTHTALDDDRPGADERRLMLTILNMELELLEPLLATGTLDGQTRFTAQANDTRRTAATRSPLAGGPTDAALNDREIKLRGQESIKRDLEAAVIHTPHGKLVLPVWYAPEAQYVPGQMAANNAKIVVPGGGQSTRAWEITTTGISEVQSIRVTGGREVTLEKFDMTAAVLFTDNPSLIEHLREKVKVLSAPAARATVDLALAKFDRVAAVDFELGKLGQGQKDAGTILASAKKRLQVAETEFQAQRYHDSRIAASEAMQLLRILQHIYWSDAVRRMYAPISSPHTLCFQTLPDHWKMMARFGRTRNSPIRNLLRSGDCEDFDTMVAAGWKHEQTKIDGVRANAELDHQAHTGSYSLRLIAAPATGFDPPATISERPVSVITPPVTVYKGQLVYISGWVKVSAPSLANLDGALFYDSLGGPAAAIRWRTINKTWEKFELVREVHETSDLTLTMALSGLGEIRFDDLEIIPLDVDANASAGPGKAAPPGVRPGPFDFLKKIPGLRGKAEPEYVKPE